MARVAGELTSPLFSAHVDIAMTYNPSMDSLCIESLWWLRCHATFRFPSAKLVRLLRLRIRMAAGSGRYACEPISCSVNNRTRNHNCLIRYLAQQHLDSPLTFAATIQLPPIAQPCACRTFARVHGVEM